MTSVILPTYNERGNIEELVGSILNIIKSPIEIIVVDDDSPDRTWEIVEEMSKVNKNIKLIRRLKERGLTNAIREGLDFARGERIILMDADFSMPPDISMQMVNRLDSLDIVVGSRYVECGRDLRDSPLRVFCSRVFNSFASWFLNSTVKDLTSGFLAFKKTAILPSDIQGRYGEYCIGLLYKAHKNGLQIKELPYNCISRRRGQTKTDPNILKFIHYGLIYIFFLLRLKFKGA